MHISPILFASARHKDTVRMTAEEARIFLPDVTIQSGSQIWPAWTTGRRCPFAHVTAHTGSGYESWEVAWSVVAHCVTTGQPIHV